MNYKGKYLNPLVIFAFKKMFAAEASKGILIAFLNEVFKGHRHVADLVYVDDRHHGKGLNSEEFLLDLLCTDDEGNDFDVELQVGRHPNFKERAIFHAFRLIHEQKFDKSAIDTPPAQLRPVYVIAFLEDGSAGLLPDGYKHHIGMCGKDGVKIPGMALNIIIIELPKFVKSDEELETELDQWIYAFKNMGNIDELPVSMQQDVFKTLFSLAERSQLSEEDNIAYDDSLKYKSAYDLSVDSELRRRRKKTRKDEFLVFRCTQISGMAERQDGETHEYIIGPLRKRKRR